MPPAELVLHPVRLRIVQAFVDDRALTTAGLRSLLPDVPVATLYRQVSALVAGGVLEVVGQRKVRGAVERTYRLADLDSGEPGDRARDSSGDAGERDRRSFATFVAGLLGDFDRYLRDCRDGGDPAAGELAGYQQVALSLTDDELLAMLTEWRDVLSRRLDLPATPGRTTRLLTTVLLPSPS
jgi:Helix-turn-helix domain